MDYLLSIFSCIKIHDDSTDDYSPICHTIPGKNTQGGISTELDEYFTFLEETPYPEIHGDVQDREMVILRRMIMSKNSHIKSSVMWKIGLFGDLWMELYHEDKCFHVIFDKIEDGTFITYIKLFGARKDPPIVDNCSYCRCIFDGEEERTYVCGECMIERYCSTRCQAMDWIAGHGYYCSFE